MVVEADLSGADYKRKIIPSLDVAKFVCAIVVVMMHTSPLDDINKDFQYAFFNSIARLAVPLFFVISGYLCFRKTTCENFDFAVPKSYVLKTLKLYILWTIIYILQFFYQSVYICEKGYVYGVVSAIDAFLFTGYRQLWFLRALAVAVLLIGLALKKQFKIRTIMLIGFILYLLGQLGQGYFFIIKPLEDVPIVWSTLQLAQGVIQTTRNGIFEGVIYVSIGMLFAYKKIVFKYVYAVVGFCISMLLFCLEMFVIIQHELYYQRDYSIFLLPTVFFLFYLITHFEMKQSKGTDQLRTYSGTIPKFV